MIALVTALALAASSGGANTLGVAVDGRVIDASGDSGHRSLPAESGLYMQGDPPPEDPQGGDPPPEDPPPEDPPGEGPPPEDPPPEDPMGAPPNEPPTITDFRTEVSLGPTLFVDGVVVDENAPGAVVHIDWLGAVYDVTPDGAGEFYWEIEVAEDDEGWVTVTAVDDGGLESDPVRDYVRTY